ARFKEINDTLGHDVGNDVLSQVADRLRSEFGDALVARTSTDGFAMVKPGGDSAVATQLCDRIERAMLAPIAVRGIEMSVRADIGVALALPGVDRPDDALHHADIAMTAAGREHVGRRLYSPDLDEHSPERLRLAAEMREAIDSGQLSLVFQPKLDIVSCRVDGVEAFVRWHHPQRGILMPGDFLATIENTELIGPLTWCVLDLALHHASAW
ncbi:MAG TPA: diguanylate cyclase, partial [Ilumatobacteraceae bacterium]|nr:diguanylate cyclase [Ilumatobacteraceae bacterium]